MCLWVLLWCALWCALCRMFRDDSAAGSGSEDEEGSEGSAGSMDDFLNDSPLASPMQVMGSPTQQTAPPSWSSGGRHPRTPGSCRMFRDDSAAGSGSEDEEGSEGSAGSMDGFLNGSPVASPMPVTGSPTLQTTPPSWSSGGRHPRTPGSGNPAERQRPRRASNAVTSPSRPPLLARTERNPQLAELQHELDFLADNFGDLTPLRSMPALDQGSDDVDLDLDLPDMALAANLPLLDVHVVYDSSSGDDDDYGGIRRRRGFVDDDELDDELGDERDPCDACAACRATPHQACSDCGWRACEDCHIGRPRIIKAATWGVVLPGFDGFTAAYGRWCDACVVAWPGRVDVAVRVEAGVELGVGDDVGDDVEEPPDLGDVDDNSDVDGHSDVDDDRDERKTKDDRPQRVRRAERRKANLASWPDEGDDFWTERGWPCPMLSFRTDYYFDRWKADMENGHDAAVGPGQSAADRTEMAEAFWFARAIDQSTTEEEDEDEDEGEGEAAAEGGVSVPVAAVDSAVEDAPAQVEGRGQVEEMPWGVDDDGDVGPTPPGLPAASQATSQDASVFVDAATTRIKARWGTVKLRVKALAALEPVPEKQQWDDTGVCLRSLRSLWSFCA